MRKRANKWTSEYLHSARIVTVDACVTSRVSYYCCYLRKCSTLLHVGTAALLLLPSDRDLVGQPDVAAALPRPVREPKCRKALLRCCRAVCWPTLHFRPRSADVFGRTGPTWKQGSVELSTCLPWGVFWVMMLVLLDVPVACLRRFSVASGTSENPPFDLPNFRPDYFHSLVGIGPNLDHRRRMSASSHWRSAVLDLLAVCPFSLFHSKAVI